MREENAGANVHPRVAMTILRHSKIAVTMDIYSQVSFGLDQGGAQTPRQPVRRGGPVNPAAVLCWSMGMKETLPDERNGPLTWVEIRGIEPLTCIYA